MAVDILKPSASAAQQARDLKTAGNREIGFALVVILILILQFANMLIQTDVRAALLGY